MERRVTLLSSRACVETSMWFWIALAIFILAVAVLAELWAGWIVGKILDRMDGPL